MYVEVKKQLAAMWVPGIELVINYDSKRLYLFSHFVGPEIVLVTQLKLFWKHVYDVIQQGREQGKWVVSYVLAL